MDFHAAMETFAEAWVAANVHTAVNTDPGQVKLYATIFSDLRFIFFFLVKIYCHGPVHMILYFHVTLVD
jgi:hypothetical protein